MKDLTRGKVMETAMKGALTGIAIGGLTCAVIDANIIASKALWRFNCLAAETVWVMAKATAEWVVPEGDDEDEYDDEDEHDDDSEPNKS